MWNKLLNYYLLTSNKNKLQELIYFGSDLSEKDYKNDFCVIKFEDSNSSNLAYDEVDCNYDNVMINLVLKHLCMRKAKKKGQ